MNFTSILSSPVWAVVATIATVIAIFISIRQQQRKSISYKVISDTPLLSLKEEVKGRVQVLFDDRPVGNARLIVLKILNSGNVPIMPADYIEPIRFGFGDNAEILDIEVLETVPADFKDTAKTLVKDDFGGVMLEPHLLNSKESITLKVSLAQPHVTKDIKVTARIVGVSQIIHVDKLPPIFTPIARTFSYVSYAVFLSIIVLLQFSKYEQDFGMDLITILDIIVYAFIYILAYLMLASIAYSLINKESLLVSIRIILNKFVDLIRYMIYGLGKN